MTGPYEPERWSAGWAPGEPTYPAQPTYAGQAADPGEPTYPGQPIYPGQPTYAGGPTYPGQPAYPGQPYPGQAAGPGQWPGYPAAGPPWAPPPRRGLPAWAWTLIAVAVIAATFLLAAVVLSGDPKSPKDAAGTNGRTLRLPPRFGDYATVRSIDPHQIAEQLRGQLSSVGSADLLDRAKIAAYGRDAQLRILFIGFELADAPEVKSQVADNGVQATVDSFIAGITGGVGRSGATVTSKARSVPPGPLGGFMKCGAIQLSAQRMGICAWGDRSAMAVTMVVNPVDDAETARLTQQVRAAAEH